VCVCVCVCACACVSSHQGIGTSGTTFQKSVALITLTSPEVLLLENVKAITKKAPLFRAAAIVFFLGWLARQGRRVMAPSLSISFSVCGMFFVRL
jgi:hypothetical protein